MQLGNGLHLFLQLAILILVYNFLLITTVLISPTFALVIEETLVCSGQQLNISCPVDTVIIFTSVTLSSSCAHFTELSSNSTGNITSSLSIHLNHLYQRCYPSQWCSVDNITSLLNQHSNNNSHLYVQYTCVRESNVVFLCGGAKTHNIEEDEEGVILSSGFYDTTENNTITEKKLDFKSNGSGLCNIVMTPVHGQFLHFNLIPWSNQGNDQFCYKPSLFMNAINGPKLELCPPTAESAAILRQAKFNNMTLSLECNYTSSPLDNFIVSFKAQGCTTASIPKVKSNTRISKYSYGTEAVIQCSGGLQKVSSETGIYTCKGDQWRGTPPNCTDLQCDPVDVPANSVVEYRHTPEGSEQVYTRCSEGYALGGDSLRSCVNYTWNGTQPFCSIVNCGSLPTIPNGQVTYSFSTFSSKATYTCIQGYHLLGIKTRTCQEDSRWSDSEPVCARIVCEHPGVPIYGTADPSKLSDYPTGTVISYSCDRGHNLTGAQQIRCDDDGSWSDPAPVCTIHDCGTPPDVLNAQAVFNSTTYEAIANYTCIHDSVTIEIGVLFCTDNGTWQGNLPNCQDTFQTTTAQYSELNTPPQINSVKDSERRKNKIKEGLIGGAVAFGILVLLLLMWLIYIYRKRRKVKLKRLDELKYEENGFFEKSTGYYDHGRICMHSELVHSTAQPNSVNKKLDCDYTPKSRVDQIRDYARKNNIELNCAEQYSNKSQAGSPGRGPSLNDYKVNGSVRSNGTIPHKPYTPLSYIKLQDNSMFETSKI